MDQDIRGSQTKRLPFWFKQELPDMGKIRKMKKRFRASSLHTVCESALCPNMGTCWEEGVATFMILGEICTRACRFCAVKSGRPLPVDFNEPREVAASVKELSLKYVVITSVTRDDLDDGGAQQFVDSIQAIREISPGTKVEVLVPDFSNKPESFWKLAVANPEVFSHNMETVRRLSPVIRPQADYDRSLKVLENFKRLCPSSFIKSSFMVGLGETDDEIVEVMRDLIRIGCDILAIGQYLAPTQSKRHMNVKRFAKPEEFEYYKQLGLKIGFKYVMSGPVVRSSFIAEKGYKECFDKVHALQSG